MAKQIGEAALVINPGRTKPADATLSALRRGRTDIQFFAHVFLGCRLHDGQLRWMEDANATVNALATANRYGKTFLIPCRHFHRCIYKLGAEERYTRPDGTVDAAKFRKTKYHTVHTAGDWETASLVFEEAHKLLNENPALRGMLKAWPRSKPPHIDFASGSKWKFRTLGHDASGIDGNSFYYISIDEAGWIADLEEKMRNVIRVRVADVQGIIDIVGTFKPGVSKDFYKICVRASVHTGIGIAFDHREDTTESGMTLNAGIERYCKEFGINLDELDHALAG